MSRTVGNKGVLCKTAPKCTLSMRLEVSPHLCREGRREEQGTDWRWGGAKKTDQEDKTLQACWKERKKWLWTRIGTPEGPGWAICSSTTSPTMRGRKWQKCSEWSRREKMWRHRWHASGTIRAIVRNHQDCCQAKRVKIHWMRKNLWTTYNCEDYPTSRLLRGLTTVRMMPPYSFLATSLHNSEKVLFPRLEWNQPSTDRYQNLLRSSTRKITSSLIQQACKTGLMR